MASRLHRPADNRCLIFFGLRVIYQQRIPHSSIGSNRIVSRGHRPHLPGKGIRAIPQQDMCIFLHCSFLPCHPNQLDNFLTYSLHYAQIPGVEIEVAAGVNVIADNQIREIKGIVVHRKRDARATNLRIPPFCCNQIHFTSLATAWGNEL